MLKYRVSAVVVLTLVLPIACNGPNFAVSPAFAAGTGEKTVPQGQDPPGLAELSARWEALPASASRI